MPERNGPARPLVAVVEDDPVLGPALAQRLRLEGFDALLCTTGAEAAAKVPKARPDALLCDIRLPDVSGEDLFRRLLPDLGSATVLFMTAFGDIGQAIRLTRAGADDYLAKPFDVEALVARLRATLRPRAAKAERAADAPASPAMRRALDVLRRAAKVDSPVLLTGETGVGKEVAARLVHAESAAADRPFVAVNCAAIPEQLADSQLFGHERGSFTGAADRHVGVLEEAADGTLFLDEVGELPAPLQAKLLRVLQERRFRRVGGAADLPFRARLVSATNADLGQAVADGRFRRDLLFRLDVIGVRIPPLRERSEEIAPLLDRFAADCAARFGIEAPTPSEAALAAAAAHDWPGNVRELRNRVERAVALAAGQRIEASDLFPERRLSADEDATPTLAKVREDAERRHIAAVLARTGGGVQEAAALLGVSRTTLWEKMRRYGLGADGDG
jgi:DNA-binding NtrC family response regulator